MANLPSIEKMLITQTATLGDAISVIDTNAQGICFVTGESGKLVGLLTDGDIRRSLLAGHDLKTLVEAVMNRSFHSYPVGTSDKELQARLSNKIRHIPLVDEAGKPVDYACIYRLRSYPIMEPLLGGNELSYITECVTTNWISSQGRFILEFERLMAEYHGVPYALAVSNGTVALHLSLVALGIGPGDEVIVPDLTFAATINAVLHAGATPVIVDVDLDTWNISPAEIEKAITPKTRAIIPVHLYGYPCEMDVIMDIAQKHGLKVIEDSAEAIGSEFKGQKVGTFGDTGTFSFFGNKTITTGEGGMVIFRDQEVYERAAILRDHGMSKTKRYWHDVIGFNYRMTNLQAAIGTAQMERIEEIVAQKLALAAQYDQHLSPVAGLKLPISDADHKNTYWLYSLRLEDNSIERDAILAKMKANGIDSRNTFYPLHEMEVYQPYAQGRYPNTELISQTGFSLPSSLNLSKEDLAMIAKNLIDLLAAHKMAREVMG